MEVERHSSKIGRTNMIIEDRAVLVEFAIDTLIYSLLKNTNDW